MDVIHNAREFLKQIVSQKVLPYEVLHPWRSRGEFIRHHSLRVEAYARRIWQTESGGNAGEEHILRIAAILHDIGGLEERENHAERSAMLAKTWLGTQPVSADDQERIIYLIADHSNKGQAEGDMLNAILKDADILDEIGVMSIFMASNWLERTDPEFFLRLSEKLKTREIPFCEKHMRLLTTDAGKTILRRKQAFIEHFIAELDFELEGTHDLMNEPT